MDFDQANPTECISVAINDLASEKSASSTALKHLANGDRYRDISFASAIEDTTLSNRVRKQGK